MDNIIMQQFSADYKQWYYKIVIPDMYIVRRVGQFIDITNEDSLIA